MKISPLDRMLLLFTSILAGYQVAVGIDGFSIVPVLAYTLAFGVLLVAGILLIIWGFDLLDLPGLLLLMTDCFVTGFRFG